MTVKDEQTDKGQRLVWRNKNTEGNRDSKERKRREISDEWKDTGEREKKTLRRNDRD